jgi:hypothetical protein
MLVYSLHFIASNIYDSYFAIFVQVADCDRQVVTKILKSEVQSRLESFRGSYKSRASHWRSSASQDLCKIVNLDKDGEVTIVDNTRNET